MPVGTLPRGTSARATWGDGRTTMLLRLLACLAVALGPAIAHAQAQPVAAGSNAAQSNRIKIDYVAPTNPSHKPLYDLLMKRGALERIQTILSPFKLPRDLTLT